MPPPPATSSAASRSHHGMFSLRTPVQRSQYRSTARKWPPRKKQPASPYAGTGRSNFREEHDHTNLKICSKSWGGGNGLHRQTSAPNAASSSTVGSTRGVLAIIIIGSDGWSCRTRRKTSTPLTSGRLKLISTASKIFCPSLVSATCPSLAIPQHAYKRSDTSAECSGRRNHYPRAEYVSQTSPFCSKFRF